MSSSRDRHAFLSYVREDAEAVDALQEALETVGIKVWRDVSDLWPGEDWQHKIREAIQSDSLAFIACFSSATDAREKSYQFEELTLAVEEYRLRPPGSAWLFTVRLSECSIPHYDLGGGRRLESTIQRSDLFGARQVQETLKLVQAVSRVLQPTTATTAVREAVRAASGPGRDASDTLKTLLRDPAGDIALDDFMRDLTRPIFEGLRDEGTFEAAVQANGLAQLAPTWLRQVKDYEGLLQPLLDPVRLAAMYGQPQHTRVWTQTMRRLTARIGPGSGLKALVALRAYPALVVMYCAAVGAEARSNYVALRGFIEEPVITTEFRREEVPLAAYVDIRSLCAEDGIIASALCYADGGTEVDDALIGDLISGAKGRRYTPFADHLHHLLRDLFRDDFISDSEYDQAFDRAEVLLDALAVDAVSRSDYYSQGGGYGRYTWRGRHDAEPVEARILQQAKEKRSSWQPIADGLFGADPDRAIAALQQVADNAPPIRQRRW